MKGKVEKIISRQREQCGQNPDVKRKRGGLWEHVSEVAGMWGGSCESRQHRLVPEQTRPCRQSKDFGIYPKPMRAVGPETGMI